MSKENSHKNTLDFLNTMDQNSLYHFNLEYWDEENSENFMRFTNAFSTTFFEISKKYRVLETSDENLLTFAIYCKMSFIVSHLEAIKKLLKILINPNLLKDGFNEDTTLGQMMHKICKKLEFDENKWRATWDLFYVDFRNAIAHQNYLISKDGLTIFHKDDTKKKTFGWIQLNEVSDDVTGIFDAFTEFSIKKLGKLEN